MAGLPFRIYLINTVLLITHEIDAAYWREWELFQAPGGITGFLLFHFLLLPLLLVGLVFVHQDVSAGRVSSLLLSVVGVTTFVVHMVFLTRGSEVFKTPISLFILGALAVVSIVQGALTLYRWNRVA